MVRRVSILGATGSIGQSTADVIASCPDQYDVQAVTANTRAEDLAAVALRLNAKRAVITQEAHYPALKEALSGTGIECACGSEAVIGAAQMPADWIMAAIVGMAGLGPLMAAIEQGTYVAIANKEPLVAAGPQVIEAARRSGAQLLPVDSEHNAIFQVFEADNTDKIVRLVLTASGGPFRTWTLEDMATASPRQALAHPNWCMGDKISIDSATMMNKALEIIEAHYFFGMPPDRIDVLVHPQSVVHSMVEYADGSVLSQMGAADMRTPISQALAWPGRMETPGQRLDLAALRSLTFEPVDHEKFPFIRMAYEVLSIGQAACIAFNAANETAVQAYLEGHISFNDIFRTVRHIIDMLDPYAITCISDIEKMDRDTRNKAQSHITALKSSARKAS